MNQKILAFKEIFSDANIVKFNNNTAKKILISGPNRLQIYAVNLPKTLGLKLPILRNFSITQGNIFHNK